MLSGAARGLMDLRVQPQDCQSARLLDVPLNQALPAHIGADQRGINVYNLCGRDLRLQASLDRALEDSAEPLLAPALADACQTRMMRQFLMQSVPDEPPDGDVDLSLAHQFAIMDNTDSKH
jgi:hypothetical protein